MNLTDVIAVWDILVAHVKDLGDLGFCDLQDAIDSVVGVVNDVPGGQPASYRKPPETNQ